MVEGSRILREYPITPGRIEGLGRRGKPLIADHVLVYRNTKLAVRFAYARNDQGIYQIDMGPLSHDSDNSHNSPKPEDINLLFTGFQKYLSASCRSLKFQI